MTTPHGSEGADREDELLRAVLAEETTRDEAEHGRRDPISPAAHARLRSGTAAAPTPQERPSVDDVYGKVDRARSAPVASAPGAVIGDGVAAPEPAPSGQVFIGADAETPDLARTRRQRPRPTGTPAMAAEPPAGPRPAEPAVEPQSAELPDEPRPAAPETAPELAGPETAPEAAHVARRTGASTPPPFEEEAPTALAEGLARTGPDTAEIRRVEASSPWTRLHSPQDDAEAVSLVPSPRRLPAEEEYAEADVPATATPPRDGEPAGSGSRHRLLLMLGALALLALLVAVLVAVLI